MANHTIQTELFRFAIPRPIQEATPDNVREHTFQGYAPAGADTEFHQQLQSLVTQDNAGALLLQEARKFIKGGDEYVGSFIANITTDLLLPHVEYDQWLYAQEWPVSFDDALAAARRIYKRDPAEVIQLADYQADKQHVMDSIMAVTIDAHGKHYHADHLVRLARICMLLESMVYEPESLQSEKGVSSVLQATPLLPKEIFPLPPVSFLPIIPQQEQEGVLPEDTRKTQRQYLQALSNALREMRRVDRAALIPVSSPPVTSAEEQAPQPLTRSIWVLKPETVQTLSKQTQELLVAEGFALDSLSPTAVIQHLTKAVPKAAANVYRAPPVSKTIRRGDSQISFQSAGLQPSGNWQPFHGEPSVPDTVGYGRYVGVADLKIVQQRLLRYEMGEIAHIENVLLNEYKERVHRRLQRLTEELVEETERTETTERDLESTEKFELKRESEALVKLDAKTDFSNEISADYGSVKNKVNFGVSMGASVQMSKKTATDYSRSVTERAKSKVEERVLERRTLTSLAETEETNTHGFDNKGGQGNVVGIYRWLDKIYEAQILNYGERGMFEFAVPEPAALYLHAITNSPPAGVTIDIPEPPEANDQGFPFDPANDDPALRQRLRPDHIDETTYQAWMSRYDVTGLEPPPKPEVLIGKSYREPASSDADVQLQHVEDIEIPEDFKQDYAATHAYTLLANPIPLNVACHAGDYGLTVAVGTGISYLDTCAGSPSGNFALDGERQQIPAAITLSKDHPESKLTKTGYAVVIEVLLNLTDAAFARWQHDAYAAIMQAYQQRKSDYENALAAASVQQGVSISGHNPAQNRDIEKNELKRAVIAQMTAQHFNRFDAMRETDADLGYPEMDFDEAIAEGEYVQFFEQAFEWENITYRFYPYFWGRKSQWLDRLVGVQDTDPLFEAFLKAGYARVMVPIRPNYDKVVAHFFGTGRIWNGGDPPVVEDPLYVSLIDDLMPKPVEAGDTWEIKLPTSLVILQADSTLPNNPPSGDNDANGDADQNNGDSPDNDAGQDGNDSAGEGNVETASLMRRWLKCLFGKH
jgi:hypothetical protein